MTDGSAAPRPLTNRENASSPVWSPDGRMLLFVRTVDGHPQVFLLSLDGGEPTQVTHFRYGASSPKWSPDGKGILFTSRIGLKELVKDSVFNPQHALPTWLMERPGEIEVNPDMSFGQWFVQALQPQRESPITYVADITTPQIIFHGENDRRTGFVQGEDNRRRIDQMLRTYEFFDRYIKH